MKNILFVSLLVIAFSVKAQISAYFSQCVFNTPEGKPYVETYLSVLGNSVVYKKNQNEKYQSQVEVGVLFSQNGQIKSSKKYTLMSPEITDTISKENFIDQQRFFLEPGEYEFEQMISDKNDNGKIFSIKKKIKIEFPDNKVNISDIELLSSITKAETKSIITKSGFDMIPYMADFYYPESINEIAFYAEIYNTKKILGENEKLLIVYYIESSDNNTQLSKYAAIKREISAPVIPFYSRFNISELPSGNYNVVVEVKNKLNETIAQKKILFQRKNTKPLSDAIDISSVSLDNTFASKITSKDSLKEFIRSLRPIATQSEKNFIDNQLKAADEKFMQHFLYNFWQTRNPLAPEDGFKKYNAEVKVVNEKFGTFVYKGHETDRGRVYLQYGPPDKREEFPAEPNAYPYEIWVYYTLEDKTKLNPTQTNKQFIFYNPDIATNNYQILHSDALGEIRDSRWEMKLHKRMVQSHDFEKKDAPRHFGGNASDVFGNPR